MINPTSKDVSSHAPLDNRLRGRAFLPGIHYVTQAEAWMVEAADEIQRLRDALESIYTRGTPLSVEWEIAKATRRGLPTLPQKVIVLLADYGHEGHSVQGVYTDKASAEMARAKCDWQPDDWRFEEYEIIGSRCEVHVKNVNYC